MAAISRTGMLLRAALVAVPCLLLATTALAGKPADVVCEQSIAKDMSKCVKKVVGLHVKCYKGTGEPCPAADAKIESTSVKIGLDIAKRCATAPSRDDSGYGYPTYTGVSLGKHFGDACEQQARIVVDRTFGRDASNYSGADTDGKKCLEGAAKNAGKHLASALKDLSKCTPGTDCTFDFSTDAAKAVEKTGKKCTDLSALTGLDPTAYIAAATGQVRSAVASPCDPVDLSRCVLPFPNDHFSVPASTDSGRQLAIGNNAIVADGNLTPVDASRWREADGFSVGPMIVLSDVDIDLTVTGVAPITDIAESLDPDTPVMLLDADTGEQQLMWMERDQRGATIDDQVLIGRVAKNLQEAHRYIVVMRNMKDGGGAPVDAPEGFAIYRDSIPTDQLPVEARRPHMEELLTTLEGYGVVRSELYLAWDFTTQSSDSAARRLLAMRDDAFDNILGAAAPAFTVDTVTEPLDADIFRQVDGTFEVPLYLNDGGIPGSTLRTDFSGTPVNEGDTFTANYRCIIPYAATTGGAGVAPAVPARISMYGHGLLGSHEEVDAGNIRDMASEHNFVFCATDWAGFSEDDALFAVTTLKDFSNFPTFIDRQHQGVLNMMFLGRLMQHADGFGSNAAFQVGGESMLDTSELFYDGNSQGGILGGVVAAFEQDATRFVLGVPGINYSTLLHRSVDFDDYLPFMTSKYPAATDQNLLLSVAQVIWDRTDPNGHVNHLTSDPYPGTPVKKLLYQVAFGDHQVAPVTAEIAARSNGASIHAPPISGSKTVPEVTPYYGIPPIASYPFDGTALVIWDSGNPAPPTGNVPPPEITSGDAEWGDLGPCPMSHGSDPHSCPRSNADARTQKSEFLKTGGAVVDVCSGAPCLAP